MTDLGEDLATRLPVLQYNQNHDARGRFSSGGGGGLGAMKAKLAGAVHTVRVLHHQGMASYHQAAAQDSRRQVALHARAHQWATKEAESHRMQAGLHRSGAQDFWAAKSSRDSSQRRADYHTQMARTIDNHAKLMESQGAIHEKAAVRHEQLHQFHANKAKQLQKG